MDSELLQLHTMKHQLLQTAAGLRIQLAHLHSYNVTDYLMGVGFLPHNKKDKGTVDRESLDIARQERQDHRDVILSELTEVRLLLGHVTDQIENWEKADDGEPKDNRP